MGIWSFYFLLKLYFYLRGYIRFNFLLNILLAVFIILPVPKTAPACKFLKIAKFILSLVLAFLLFWYDSWLPPLFYSIRKLMETGGISSGFIIRFIASNIDLIQASILTAVFIITVLLRRYLKFLTPVIFILMLLVPLLSAGKQKEDMGTYLNAFYQSESKRIVHFEKAKSAGQDFDIIILHICSLSWDDLRTVGMENNPFFKQFNFLFTNFNSVSSYTTPSIIRLLRENCGQERHDALYHDSPKECFLLESLRGLGYETYSAVDNDAPPSYNWIPDAINYGLIDPPIDFRGLPIRQYDFDNSPIYDDLSILKRWWDIRQKSGGEKAALYFDITTLHIGAHWTDDKDWWKKNPSVLYGEYLANLFENLQNFFNVLASSGRNFVVIFIPEHGAALRSSSIQAADIRDIPLPKITLIPVGIKFIGKRYPLDSIPQQKIISKPASYLAISYLLSSFLKESPFDGTGRFPSQNLLTEIPETNFVSANKEAIIVKKGSDHYLCGKDKQWVKLPPSAVP